MSSLLMNQLPINCLSSTPISPATNKRTKKSVKFDNFVHCHLIQKATSKEAACIWFSFSELSSFKSEGKELASSYRESNKESTEYRGCEHQTLRRQRQKVLSNRSAVYAHKQGMNTKEISDVYKDTSRWSNKVAFVTAVHDCIEIYPSSFTSEEEEGLKKLPYVGSMIPPPPLPFAILSVKALQQQQKKKRRVCQ